MPLAVQLYVAADEDAEAIAAGEYAAPRHASLPLPGDLDGDDLAALNGLLGGCRIDPHLSVVDGELLAEGADVVVYRALPEFVERLAALEEGGCRAVATRWAEFLSEGEDEEGWWTLARAQRVLKRLSAFARRARRRDLPVLLASRGL
jgi:hypothetical protein